MADIGRYHRRKRMKKRKIEKKEEENDDVDVCGFAQDEYISSRKLGSEIARKLEKEIEEGYQINGPCGGGGGIMYGCDEKRPRPIDLINRDEANLQKELHKEYVNEEAGNKSIKYVHSIGDGLLDSLVLEKLGEKALCLIEDQNRISDEEKRITKIGLLTASMIDGIEITFKPKKK